MTDEQARRRVVVLEQQMYRAHAKVQMLVRENASMTHRLTELENQMMVIIHTLDILKTLEVLEEQ